jgi:AmpD protein
MKSPHCWWFIILVSRRGICGPWIDALFTGTIDPDAHPFFAEIAHLRVSAHCLIRRDGEVVQYVPLISAPGMPACRCITARTVQRFFYRDRTGRHGYTPYTDSQYQQLAAVTRTLIGLYPAIADNITGHSDIAPEKTDPGPALTGPVSRHAHRVVRIRRYHDVVYHAAGYHR